MFYQAGEFNSSFLRYKKIVIVKFNSVATEILFQVFYVLINLSRRFTPPPCIINRNNGTERTCKRAAHAGMISDGFCSEISLAEVARQRVKPVKLLIRQRRKFILVIQLIFRRLNDLFP